VHSAFVVWSGRQGESPEEMMKYQQIGTMEVRPFWQR
jgi:hypothetical protein